MLTRVRAIRKALQRPFSENANLSRKEARRQIQSQFERTSERFIQGKTGQWEMVIGLEVHAQVVSQSKLFSDSATDPLKLPNSQTADLDVGFPGSLPVLNSYCVDQAIRTGLALNGTVNNFSRFDRKHYFYHDLPLGFQITQYFRPIVSGGHITLDLPEGTQNVRLQRIQLETDSAKSIHDMHPSLTLIDFNRAGIALMEIITEPEIHTSSEAAAFLKKLTYLLEQIQVCMSEVGEGMRCDANVSVRRVGDTKLGERCEIKNLNSISALRDALEYEARRQIDLLESNQEVELETRWFDPVKKVTSTARRKADKTDYRFFPEPDLPPLRITNEHIEAIRKTLPELPDQACQRLQSNGLSHAHAALISMVEGATQYFFEAFEKSSATLQANPTLLSQWVINELFSYREQWGKSMSSFKLTPHHFATILSLFSETRISAENAKKVIEVIVKEGGNPQDIIKKNDWELKQVDVDELRKACQKVLDENPEDVENYKAGDQQRKSRILRNFMGKMGKTTNGKLVSITMQDLLSKLGDN